MIEWERIDPGLRVVDDAKTELVVGTAGWTTGGTQREIPHRVDATVTGTVRELRLDYGFATLTGLATDRTVEIGGQRRPFDLGDTEYLLNLDANIKTYVRFRGPAELVRSDDYENLRLSFPEPAPVTIGFRSRLDAPDATVTVPETIEGVATAVTHAASAHRTSSPDRSYATLRGHPPIVAYDDDYDVPDVVADATPDTGIELRVPDCLETLLVTAPLAYYLGATVTVEPGVAPQVAAPETDVRVLLDDPALVETVPDTLARAFWLDCLVRNAGPHAVDLVETRLLDEVGIDAERAYHATPAERLRAYLDAPYHRIADDLPDWHLAMHVEPTFDNAATLPYLFDRLSLVYPPDTEELEGQELMERSLDDFYRGPSSAPSIDVVKPKLRRGRFHGWLAEHTPIDVFKALPDAFSNRFDYLDRGGGDLAVTVVLNETTMEGEQSEVAEIYRERSADLPLDVTLRHDLSRAELADVFAAENDFVHYIGHCEETGLLCENGTLPIDDIPESNTQTFFLNACGSYYEGIDLIRKGSVAGAVTFRKVLDRQAAKVGTAFARLLVNGFSFERALQLARRRIMMGKDYGVVGDGTHVLAQSENVIPSTAEVELLDDGCRLTVEAVLAHNTGGLYQPNVPGHDRSYLLGNEVELSLDGEAASSFFERARMPVVYDGEFYWSSELADKFG